MVSVWLSSTGVIHHSFLPNRMNITADVHCEELNIMMEMLARLQPALINCSASLLLHNNTPPHTAQQIPRTEVGSSLSLPLQTSTFFRIWKTSWREKNQYPRNSTVFEEFVASRLPDFFKKGINKVTLLWQKYIGYIVTVIHKSIEKVPLTYFMKNGNFIGHSLNSANDGDKKMGITVYDNTIEVDRLLYGNIIKMDDLYLPNIDNIDTFDDISETFKQGQIKKNNFVNPIWNLDDLNLPNMNKWHDIKEFNDVTKSVRNITKNITNFKPGSLTRRYWYEDPQDGFDEYYSSVYIKETDKKNRLTKLMITFLIHARYQIKKIMTAKSRIRVDKKYKIGFLFNRLRHLHYEQTKLVSMSIKNEKEYYYRDVSAMMKFYEKVLRFDVDIIDTIAFIKSVDLEKEIFPAKRF